MRRECRSMVSSRKALTADLGACAGAGIVCLWLGGRLGLPVPLFCSAMVDSGLATIYLVNEGARRGSAHGGGLLVVGLLEITLGLFVILVTASGMDSQG